MKPVTTGLFFVIALLAVVCAPAYATVAITSLTPSQASPQLLGTAITWTATATDSNANLLYFQFNVAVPHQSLVVTKDYDTGTLSGGVWTGLPFVWVPTGVEGTYQIQVVIKDFTSGETTSKTVTFTVKPLATGSTPVVVATANPLVALFGAPSCATGSSIRVTFQEVSKKAPATSTTYQNCHPPATVNFEIAGMYPSTTYDLVYQVKTGGTMTNGPTITFTTGTLPSNLSFPTATLKIPAGANTDKALPMLLLDPVQFGLEPVYPDIATDLAGRIMWYYNSGLPQSIILARPLVNGTMLTLQSTPTAFVQKYLRQIDLAGNIIKETNTAAISQELTAMGVTDAAMCSTVPNPPQVGDACLGAFSHDAIQTLPNGYTATLITAEKIFPVGTQGDTSGKLVDVVGEIMVVLDKNWQVVWYFDTFEHASGAPQLDINRAAVLGETCTTNQAGCPPMYLLGQGVNPQGKDWLHGNSLYYWPTDSGGGASGDILYSSRHQDWVMKIDYNNGTGTGNILWRLGPCGDFTFNNIYNDPWPWNSHQHEAGIENNGAGPLTFFDNGNTRVSLPGKSTGCIQGVGSGDSRGMALTVNDTPSNLQVTPVLSADLGVYSTASGSAQLLPNGNYFYVPAVVLNSNFTLENSFAIELLPTAGTDTGTQVLNVENTGVYRVWQMQSLYNPPTT